MSEQPEICYLSKSQAIQKVVRLLVHYDISMQDIIDEYNSTRNKETVIQQ
jgi:succinate dehydrogenase hydrophobic anchor subunit